jgi:hypothetical protein
VINTPTLYSGGLGFKPVPGYLLSWVCSSFSSVLQGKYRDSDSHICLFKFIRVDGGATFMKHCKGRASYRSLGTSVLDAFHSYQLSWISAIMSTIEKGRVMAQVVSLSPRRAGFAPGSIHVGFMVDKVALGQDFLLVLRVSPVNIIPPSLSKLISSGECVVC